MSSGDALSQLRNLLASPPGVSDEDKNHTSDDQQRSRPELSNLLSTVKSLGEHSTQADYVTAVQLLADGARDERWRPTYYRSDVLEYVLDNWDICGPVDLSMQILRLWGNSCVDYDRNRGVATARGLEKLAQALDVSSLTALDWVTRVTGVNALYNTCLDYEPAQQRAVQLHLHNVLIRILTVSPSEESSTTCELIAMLVATARAVDPALLGRDALETLLKVALAYESGDETSGYFLTAVMSWFIADPSLWAATDSERFARDALLLVDRLSRQLSRHRDIDDTDQEDEDQEGQQTAAALLSEATSALVESYDASATPESPLLQSCFIPWLSSRNELLQATASLVLGNLLLKYPQLAPGFVKDSLHQKTLATISSNSGLATKHASAGLLTAMVLPVESKHVIMSTDVGGQSIIWPAIKTLLNEKDFTLIQDAFTLFTAFVRNSIEACRCVMIPTADTNSLIPLSTLTSTCSKMHGNSPFTADSLATCARGLTAMTRTLLKPGMPSIDVHVEAFFSDPWVLYPLTETLRYSKDKTRRLDCTVGLARIACSHPEGAVIVARALSSDSSTFLEAIRQACDGDETEARANCHVIVESVLRLASADCSPHVQEVLRSIQRTLVNQPS